MVFDSAFFDDTWIPGPFSIESTTTPEFEMARVNKSYRKKNFGLVEIVFVIFEKGKKKIVETQNKIFLPHRKRVVALMKRIGFETELYFDFSEKKSSGTVSVLVGRKPAAPS